MAAIPIGSRIAARCQRVPSHSRSIDNVITPITIMAMPSAGSGRGASSSRTAATATANSGVKLLSAPEMLGPMRRLASNVSSVTVAGNSRPTRTKINAPRGSHPSQSSMKGASAENSSAEVGMLTDAPRFGGMCRSPNWVSTSAIPKRKEAHSASTCGLSSKSQAFEIDIQAGYAIRPGRRAGDFQRPLMRPGHTAELFQAVDRDDVELRVFLADLQRRLKFGRIVPTLQRLHAVPAKDHDRAARQVARNRCSRSCRHILPAVILDRFLRRRVVFLGVALLVAELVDGDHVDRRFGLRMQRLDGSTAKGCSHDHRQRDAESGFHDCSSAGAALRGRERIARQHEAIKRAKLGGHPTAAAEMVQHTLHQSLRAFEKRRNQIFQRMEAKRES